MSRKFISSILVAAITVTGISLSAAPAKAGNEDLAKLLFGAGALIIIGKAISSNNNQAQAATRTETYKPKVYHQKPKAVHKPKVQHKPKPKRNIKALPSSCLRQYNSWDGRVRMLGKHCLNRKYKHVNRLPQACKVQVHTNKGLHRGYQMRCLRNKGFVLASN